MIKLIAGLANPGKKYSNTRHNIGSWYIRLLAKKLCVRMKKKTKFFGYISTATIFNSSFYLLLPNIFINLNGISIFKVANFYEISLNEILVVHDELNFPPGVAKFKFGGGHGGHNGLKNIINNFSENPNFYRLRIGIGHPGNKNQVINFVLNVPSSFEKKLINKAINEAIICTEMWFQEGKTKAISRLHSFKVK